MVPIFSIQHQLPAAQNREVLREVRLFDPEPLLKSSAGKFPVPQHLDDGDAGGVREGLKDTRLVGPQSVMHDISIFDLSNIRKLRDRRIARVPRFTGLLNR